MFARKSIAASKFPRHRSHHVLNIQRNYSDFSIFRELSEIYPNFLVENNAKLYFEIQSRACRASTKENSLLC